MHPSSTDERDNLYGTHSNVLRDATTATALAEVIGGAVLHALHIPFSGYFLSLHQITWQAWLFRRTGRPNDILKCSSTTALLKPVAPYGKKVTPMLAIQAQGVLHTLPLKIMPNYWGNIFGAGLSSVWGFVQPLLLYSFIFSPAALVATQKSLFQMLERYFAIHLTFEQVIIALVVMVIFKCILAIALAHAAWHLTDQVTHAMSRLGNVMISRLKQNQNSVVENKRADDQSAESGGELRGESSTSHRMRSVVLRSLMLLKQPLFIIGTLITLLTLAYTEAELGTLTRTFLRILGCAVLSQLLLEYLPLSQERFPLLHEVRAELKRLSRS